MNEFELISGIMFKPSESSQLAKKVGIKCYLRENLMSKGTVQPQLMLLAKMYWLDTCIGNLNSYACAATKVKILYDLFLQF